MLTGGKWNTNNSSYYLYTNKDWWALSPGYFFIETTEEGILISFYDE